MLRRACRALSSTKSRITVQCFREVSPEETPAEPTPAAPEPAPVAPDARMADAAPVSVAEEQRGQKRLADEASAPRPQSSPLLSQLQGYKGQRVGSPVEPTEARHTGLRPLGLAEIRRANARDALEARREGTLQG